MSPFDALGEVCRRQTAARHASPYFLLSSRDLILATTLVSCLRDAFVSVIDVRIDVSAGMTAGQVEGNAL